MKTVQAPEEEQKICVTCGFCCDGTHFMHAHLNEGERGLLAEKIEKASYTEEGKDYFRLPCGYFSSKCTIYDRKRANVCGSYRCQLLKDFAEGKISVDDALVTVGEAKAMRRIIMDEFRRISWGKDDTCFRQVLISLGKYLKLAGEGVRLTDDQELLIAKCNIFEALLIRHFRSEDDFEKLVMK